MGYEWLGVVFSDLASIGDGIFLETDIGNSRQLIVEQTGVYLRRQWCFRLEFGRAFAEKKPITKCSICERGQPRGSKKLYVEMGG